MKYLTAVEAARRLNRTEKTVRRWIAEGRLSAHHISKNRLAIPEPEVERLARELEQYEESTPPEQALIDRLAALESRVTKLEKALEQSLKKTVEPPLQTKPVTDIDQESHRPTAATEQKRLEDVPPGSLLARRFAELHNVNPRTFHDQIVKGIRGERVEATARPKAGRPKETERWLSPEQQQLALAFWQRHGVRYTE